MSQLSRGSQKSRVWKTVTNLNKVISVLFVVFVFTVQWLRSGEIPSVDSVQSLLIMAVVILLPFLPIDLSLVVTNFIKLKTGIPVLKGAGDNKKEEV